MRDARCVAAKARANCIREGLASSQGLICCVILCFNPLVDELATFYQMLLLTHDPFNLRTVHGKCDDPANVSRSLP